MYFNTSKKKALRCSIAARFNAAAASTREHASNTPSRRRDLPRADLLVEGNSAAEHSFERLDRARWPRVQGLVEGHGAVCHKAMAMFVLEGFVSFGLVLFEEHRAHVVDAAGR